MRNSITPPGPYSTVDTSAHKRFLFGALLPLVFIIVAGVLSAVTEPDSVPAASSAAGAGKLLHFAICAMLSTLLFAALPGTPASRALCTLGLLALLILGRTAIDGLIHRHIVSVLDWKFDMLASLTSVGLLMLLFPVSSHSAGCGDSPRVALRAAPSCMPNHRQ